MAYRIPCNMFLDQASEEIIDKRISNKQKIKQQEGAFQKQVHHVIYNTLPLKEQVSSHVKATNYIHNLEYSNKYGKMFFSTTTGIQIRQLSDLSSDLQEGQMNISLFQYMIPTKGQIFLSPDQERLAILNQKQLVIYQIANFNTNKRFPNTDKGMENITWLNQNQLYGWKFFKEAYAFDLINQKCQNVQGIKHCTAVEKVGANIIIAQGLILKIFRLGKLQKQIDIAKIYNEGFALMQFNKLFGIKRVNNLASQQFNQDDIYILFFVFYEDPEDSIACTRSFSFMKGNLKQEVVIKANEILDSAHDHKKYYVSQLNEQYGFQMKIIFLDNFVAINVQHTEKIYAIDLTEQFDNMSLYDFYYSHTLKTSSFFKGIALLKNTIDFQMKGASKQNEVDTKYLLRLYLRSKQMEVEGFIPFPTSIIVLDEKQLYRRYAVSTNYIVKIESQDFKQQTKSMIQNKRLKQPEKQAFQSFKQNILSQTLFSSQKVSYKNSQQKKPSSIEVKQKISQDSNKTFNPFMAALFNSSVDQKYYKYYKQYKQQKNDFLLANKNIFLAGTKKIEFDNTKFFGESNKVKDKFEIKQFNKNQNNIFASQSQSLFKKKSGDRLDNAKVQQKREQPKDSTNIFTGSIKNSTSFNGSNNIKSNNVETSKSQNSSGVDSFNNNSSFQVNNTQNSGGFGSFNNKNSSFVASKTAKMTQFGSINNGLIFGKNSNQKNLQSGVFIDSNHQNKLFNNSANSSSFQFQQEANANRSANFDFGISYPHGPLCSQHCPYFNTLSNNCIFNRRVAQPAPQPLQPLQINVNIQYSLPLNLNLNGFNYIGISQLQQIFQLGMQAFNYQQPSGIFGQNAPTSDNFKIELNHSFSQSVQGNVKKVKESTKMQKIINNSHLMKKGANNDQSLSGSSLQKQGCQISQQKLDFALLFDNKKQQKKKLEEKEIKIEESKINRLRITPDTTTQIWKYKNYGQGNPNKNVYILNAGIFFLSNWLCSFDLPFDGEYVFTIKYSKLSINSFFQVKEQSQIDIGVMKSEMKHKKKQDTLNHSIFLSLPSQQISIPNEEQTGHKRINYYCQPKFSSLPCLIECHVNRNQNTITWYYNQKDQAKLTMPKSWKNVRKICAVVQIYTVGDCVEFM